MFPPKKSASRGALDTGSLDSPIVGQLGGDAAMESGMSRLFLSRISRHIIKTRCAESAHSSVSECLAGVDGILVLKVEKIVWLARDRQGVHIVHYT